MEVTWIDVMELAREMDAYRRQTGHLDEAQAGRLLTLLLDFHQHTVTPSTRIRAAIGRDTSGPSR